MNKFLELPEEILALIFRYIVDKDKCKELITFSPLQIYALKKRYKKYIIGSDCKYINFIDGSVNDLLDLYKKYEFKPPKIIGKLHEILELFEVEEQHSKKISSFENSNSIYNFINDKNIQFELCLNEFTKLEELETILTKINVVGIHFQKNGRWFHNIEFQGSSVGEYKIDTVKSFLEFMEPINLSTLSTPYKNSLIDYLPISLKKLTLFFHDSPAGDLKLGKFINLKCFTCESLNNIQSLDELQLPISLKYLELLSCSGLNYLHNLDKFTNLIALNILGCYNFFDFINTSFPDSLRSLIYWPSLTTMDIKQIYNDVCSGNNNEFKIINFSKDGQSFIIGSDFQFPHRLINLAMADCKRFILEPNTNLECLSTVRLIGLTMTDLNGILKSLPKIMNEVYIQSSNIINNDEKLVFPSLIRLGISKNKFEYGFEVKFSYLDRIQDISITRNEIMKAGKKIEKDGKINQSMDPTLFLSPGSVHKYIVKPSGTHNSSSVLETFQFPNLGKLNLEHRQTRFICNLIDIPQISFLGCEVLRSIRLINVDFDILNLNLFPITLQDLHIKGFKLNSISGKFSTLQNLKQLSIINSKINYDMLVNQTFPDNLETLDLSQNKLEDLTCLNITNCTNLSRLHLRDVTKLKKPKGATDLRNFVLKINSNSRSCKAYLSAYASPGTRIIFEIRDGKVKTY
ncbi:hypothetical protein KGF54_001981 [Candida jiufengensis]|uniref:uncharacterized protein n=1 Tax=Candida jiufengensis TaxID=497108 RepID=UPI00222468E6|nr:uncharacterized protein KGF54_001981 [Candida jiufengensis]KAI5954206.1 hypothetical protein KGF54_001981 [Candida jiufengensis]